MTEVLESSDTEFLTALAVAESVLEHQAAQVDDDDLAAKLRAYAAVLRHRRVLREFYSR